MHLSPSFNWKGEFNHPDIERDFHVYERGENIRHLILMKILFALVYVGFAVPDYFITVSQNRIAAISLVHGSFLLEITLAVFLLLRTRASVHYELISIIGEFWAFGCFLSVVVSYDRPVFFVQIMGLLVLILAFFMLPNRWIVKVVNSAVVLLTFFLVLPQYYPGILSHQEFYFSIAYAALIFAISAVYSFQLSVSRRHRFYAEQTIIENARCDALTGAYNRGYLDMTLSEALRRRPFCSFAIAFVDADHFKQINDVYGHLEGDRILRQMVAVCRDTLRETDWVARWGGEEFVLFLDKVSVHTADQICSRIRESFLRHDFGIAERVTCSIGYTMAREGDSLDYILQRADHNCYHAKACGRNCISGDIHAVHTTEIQNYCTPMRHEKAMTV